tara:strand:- start:836 stop:1507 length:672 start_codon:yes stop_codon:yes gene_type:complete
MTFREIINEVLIRLREDTISSDWVGSINDPSGTTTDYQKVIGSLVNDAKRSVESVHNWLALRETVNLTTVAGTTNYSLGSGQEFKVIDVINTATGNNLVQVSQHYLNSVKYPTEATGEPRYYGFKGTDASSNLKIDLAPQPTEAQVLAFDLLKYQDELSTAADVLKVPAKPVILGAYARAISERGEDGGTQSGLAAMESSTAISHAIMLDSGNTQYETDWFVN